MTTTTAPRPRTADTTRAYLLRQREAMRDAQDRAMLASSRWNRRVKQIETRVSLRALSRGLADWQYEVALRAEKNDDVLLADYFAEYAFWRDECTRVAAVLSAEVALLQAMGGAR